MGTLSPCMYKLTFLIRYFGWSVENHCSWHTKNRGTQTIVAIHFSPSALTNGNVCRRGIHQNDNTCTTTHSSTFFVSKVSMCSHGFIYLFFHARMTKLSLSLSLSPFLSLSYFLVDINAFDIQFIIKQHLLIQLFPKITWIIQLSNFIQIWSGVSLKNQEAILR